MFRYYPVWRSQLEVTPVFATGQPVQHKCLFPTKNTRSVKVKTVADNMSTIEYHLPSETDPRAGATYRPDDPDPQPPNPITSTRTTAQHRTVLFLAVIIFWAAFAGALEDVPETRLLEDVLCHQFYEDVYEDTDPIDEMLCKVDVIQSELAYLLGVSSTVDAIVGKLVRYLSAPSHPCVCLTCFMMREVHY